MLFVCYPKCTTCQRAQKYLDSHGVPFTVRDIKTDNPSEEELRRWYEKSGLPLKRFLIRAACCINRFPSRISCPA